jgi:hypothetical protein
MILEHRQVADQNLEQRPLSLLEISVVIPSSILTLEALLIFGLSFSLPHKDLLWFFVIGAVVIAFIPAFAFLARTGRSVQEVGISLCESRRGVISSVGVVLAFVSLILFPLSSSVGLISLAIVGMICCMAAVICLSLALLLGGFSLPEVPLF